MQSWLIRIIGVLGLMLSTPHTATATDDAQLTIMVRDADGNRLSGVYVEIVVPQPPAAPRLVVQRRTDADGRLPGIELDVAQEYVLQFHGAAPVMLNGEKAGTKLIQTATDQNALRSADPPGFPVDGTQAGTLRFVIGGTFSEGVVAAVPMLDLATSDAAPVRPVNPLTGDELTPEQARTFHAVIGEPWGVVRAAASASPAPRAIDRTDAFPDVSNARRLMSVMLIVALALAIQALMFWHRRRSA
jgi:hypothetical protein